MWHKPVSGDTQMTEICDMHCSSRGTPQQAGIFAIYYFAHQNVWAILAVHSGFDELGTIGKIGQTMRSPCTVSSALSCVGWKLEYFFVGYLRAFTKDLLWRGYSRVSERPQERYWRSIPAGMSSCKWILSEIVRVGKDCECVFPKMFLHLARTHAKASLQPLKPLRTLW